MLWQKEVFFMKLTRHEYGELVKEFSPNSPMGKDLCFAFLIGGAICTVGQAVMNFWTWLGLSMDDAGTATSATMIFFGAVLTALSLYDNIAKHAGAGTLVPITGFSNAVVSPAMEFKSEGFILGMAAKMFTIAGPVIVYGVSASVMYGVIYWITTAF